MLNALFSLSTLAAVLRGAELWARPDVGARHLVGYGVVLALCVLGWLAARAQEPSKNAWLVGAFTVAAVTLVFVGDGPFTLPMFLMALLLLVPRFGPRAGVALVGALTLFQAVAMRLLLDRGWSETLVQTSFSAMFFTFGLVLAWVIAEHEAQRLKIADLLARTRRGFAAEKELVLSDERARAARELHDGLGHDLTLISMSLRWADRMKDTHPDQAWAEVGQARERAGASLRQMRRWVRALHPLRSGDATGVAALQAVADGFESTDLEVAVESSGPDQLPGHDTALFTHRFVQEGLTNVLRHAGCTRVVVRHDTRPGWLSLAVLDGGGGNDGEPVTDGFGLRSLRERATALGGTILAEHTPEGFALRAELPVGAP